MRKYEKEKKKKSIYEIFLIVKKRKRKNLNKGKCDFIIDSLRGKKKFFEKKN